jgi:endonuclease-3 related protein
VRDRLLAVYRRLRRRFGHAGWWPGKTAFEVCVGAILTQNTSWGNVELALSELRGRRLLSYRGLARLSTSRLAALIRSSGTFRVKARRLAAFVRFVGAEYGGRVAALARERPEVLRSKLLTVHGIGPETADAIALYAAGAPIFVIDAYTRRVFTRLGHLEGGEDYEQVQRVFMQALPRDAALFGDYHAQIVRLAKDCCRARPLCQACPLDELCPKRGVAPARPLQKRAGLRLRERATPGLVVLLLSAALAQAAVGADTQDFWKHWGDGKAELSGYRLTQPRYGAARAGSAVLIFVTESMSESLRVKADPGRHAASDVHPVMKLNEVRDFQTGIYDYNVLTSVFARVAAGWPVAKISFSSQEWCGHVYHQLIPRADRVAGVFHSYFDGEADGSDSLPLPKDGVFEDALPILLRGWKGEYLRAGETRSVPLLPSLLSARLGHRRLAWGRATISRSAATSALSTPAGRFEVVTWTVARDGADTTTFAFEAQPPYRLVRRSSDGGEELALTGSTRLAYWKLNGPGGERYLKELALPSPRR